ncbi:MAG: type III ribulose-bisphosphate carboxylase [Candidatus Aenigmarchaeota archaeon]|nr:type III ribulose-bisphosphate carboxylase [Candidatus Aenigmarchaeota archaeon]
MKYSDYVDLKYEPSRDDLIAIFSIKPHSNVSMKVAAGAVAAESSTGTWDEVLTEKEYVKKYPAKVFSIKDDIIKVAYPLELFEPGNIPNLLSSIAGNIFGMKIVRRIKLLDVIFPKKYVKKFKGPKYGISGIRKMLRVKKRPLLGTIIKPKLGLKADDHARVAYEAWTGGCDLVKDDENLTSQGFNKFEDRLKKTLKMLNKAEKETGERKGYLINITAETDEMIRRAELVEKNDGIYVMVDIITVGWAALQTLRNQGFNLIIHAHRAGHAAFTRSKTHGISMLVIAKIARLIGVDQLHTGTGELGKMKGEETKKINNFLTSEFFGLREVFPVASGGLHPGIVDLLIEKLGNNIVIQAGGGIHAHPKGTFAGAKAMRQAIEAVMKNEKLEEYAKTKKELAEALKKWGRRVFE